MSLMDAARTQTTFSVLAASGALVAALLLTPSTPEAKTLRTIVTPHETTAADILEASLVARGGRVQIAKTKSMEWFGTVSVTESGITGRFESFSAMPRRERFKLIWDGDFYTMDVDGDSVTETFPSGTHDVVGTERDQELLDANFDYDLRWQELFPTVKLNGIVNFEGKKAWSIEMVAAHTGIVRTRYIDAESYLPLGEDRDIVISERGRNYTTETNGRDHFLVRMVYSDYRTIDGVKYAYHWVRLATGHPNLPEMVYQTDRVEANQTWK
jgi:hypothetical protein